MADAMVTARMPQAKKEAGAKILAQTGSSASQFINSAYDYLIQHGASPFEAKPADAPPSAELIKRALAQIEGMCLPAGNRFASMGDDEIRRERLARKGLGAR